MKVRVFDFFCGCGGTSLGLQSAGMRIVAGIDCDEDAGRTFKSHFPRARFLRRDIRHMRTSELSRLVSKKRRAPILFACCAPCQPFSKQNGSPVRGDGRKYLLEEFARFVRKYKPDFILCENVPGVQHFSGHRGPFAALVKVLKQLGYTWAHGVIDSRDYGVPQHRRRLVLLASRRGEIDLPKPTHGRPPLAPYSTVWQWIGSLRPIQAGETDANDPMHRAANLSEINLRRIKATPPGGSRSDWPEDLMLRCHRGSDRTHSDVYGRLRKDRPASAMTTRCVSLSNGRFGHPVQNRALSVREAACLQTFPGSSVFHGCLTSIAKQVGNAVPVLLAKRLGEEFVRLASSAP